MTEVELGFVRRVGMRDEVERIQWEKGRERETSEGEGGKGGRSASIITEVSG